MYFLLALCNAVACSLLSLSHSSSDLCSVIFLQHLKDLTLKFNDEEKIQYSKYIVQMLLPYLKQFHAEQLVEKEMEAKIHGIFPATEINFVGKFHNVIAGLLWYLLVSPLCEIKLCDW